MAQSKDGEGRNGPVERRRRKEWPSRANAKKEILDGLIFRLERSEMAKEGETLDGIYEATPRGKRTNIFTNLLSGPGDLLQPVGVFLGRSRAQLIL